jgi:dynactin 1
MSAHIHVPIYDGCVDKLTHELAQRIGAHASELRSTKDTLRLSDIENFLDEVVAESAAPADMHPWDVIASFISRLGTQITSCLAAVRSAASPSAPTPCALVPNTTPWSARVLSLRATSQQNSDTERKLLLFSEENKTLQREVKLRDQSLQEAGVKVETLEKRLEGSRKMADVIVELENDVAKAKKQEKVYEDAIEQVQKELEEVERELAAAKKDGGRTGELDRSARVGQRPREPARATAADEQYKMPPMAVDTKGWSCLLWRPCQSKRLHWQNR